MQPNAGGSKQEGKQPLKREDLGLGWLAGSTVQPRKRREIEGVSGATIMDLQAQLYQTQQAARMSKETGAAASSRQRANLKAGLPLMDKRNPGIEARDQRDRLELKVRHI